MKKGLVLIVITLVCCTAIFMAWRQYRGSSVKEKAWQTGESEEDEEQKSEAIEARWQYEIDLLKDPKTGLIPAGIRQRELAVAKTLPVTRVSQPAFDADGRRVNGVNTPTSNVYLPAGPENMGGRTRALAFDKRYNGGSNRVIIAGCVSGGIMRSADGGASWTLVTPDQQVHSITSIAQDPRPGFQDTWYVGTGEALGNSATATGAFFSGNGIFKSTDNGLSWTPLTSTQTGTLQAFDNAFDFVHRLAVNPANGDILAACHNSIQRSQNGGISWTMVKGSSGGNTATGNTDILISSDGSKIFCSFHLKNVADRGVWQSSTGAAGSWTLLGGNVDGSPSGWKVNNTTANWGRIVLSIAPSDENILYVMYENGNTTSGSTEADLFKLNIASGSPSWTNLSGNLPGGLTVQGGYDMLLAVKPDDLNIVLIGGVILYRSTVGFATPGSATTIGGSSRPNSHADMHLMVFDPTNVKRAFACNDGGIQSTEDISATVVSWVMLPRYQTIQYYYVAIDPESGKNNFLGGAQDNGTWYRDASLNFGPRPITRPNVNDFVQLAGGDGVAVDIAKISLGKQLTYFGAQLGVLIRDELLDNVNYPGGLIRPRITELIANTSSGYGDFVTYFKLSNSNSEVLFYVNYSRLFKTNSASTVDSTSWTALAGVEGVVNPARDGSVSIRAIDFSWGPYLTSHAMYIGTSNSRIYRIDDYANANGQSSAVNITPPGLAGNVQDIAVNPNDDNEVMAVVSNYNTTSIWFTTNAKSASPTWSNAEGNLTLPSIRSCAIVVKKDAGNNPITEYYVGTSVGLYATESIKQTLAAGGSITWSREGASILNFAVVTTLDYRPEDNVLLIGTHGNGMYFSSIGSPNFIPNLATAISPILNDKNFITVFPTVSTGLYQYGRGSLIGIRSLRILVTDIAGHTVYQKQVGYVDGSIPLGNLPAGTYVIQITSEDKKYRTLQKVIKL
jgi:hypothetical protein